LHELEKTCIKWKLAHNGNKLWSRVIPLNTGFTVFGISNFWVRFREYYFPHPSNSNWVFGYSDRLFLTYYPQMKVGLQNHQSVCTLSITRIVSKVQGIMVVTDWDVRILGSSIAQRK
jgi:hypothetical protein